MKKIELKPMFLHEKLDNFDSFKFEQWQKTNTTSNFLEIQSQEIHKSDIVYWLCFLFYQMEI